MNLVSLLLSVLLALQTPIMGAANRKTFPAHGTAGPRTPTATTNAYTNSSRITACDGSFATVAVAAGSNGTAIQVSAFGFGIPSGATIAGITAHITHQDISANGGIKDFTVGLLKAGASVGSNMASGTQWAQGTPETFTYGGTSNLWGTTWTPADINASGFGVQFAPKNTDILDGTATVGVDCITVTVTY